MKTTTLAIAAAMAAGTLAHAQEAVQWRVEDGGNGHWYERIESPGIWEHARLEALSRGGHLATVTSRGEQDFITALGAALYWLGGFAPPNQGCGPSAWMWVTGEPMSYLGWAAGEPGTCSHTCMQFAVWGGYTGRWNNQICSEASTPGYMIEYSADCNGDGLVDYGQILDGTLFDGDNNGIPDCCELGYDCNTNLVINGSFEVGPGQPDCSWVALYPGDTQLAPWVVTQSSVDRLRLSEACTNESWQSYAGEFTVDLDGFSTAGAIEQHLQTEGGRQYQLTLQLTANCGNTQLKRVRVTVGDTSAEFQTNCQPSNPQAWVPVTMPFIATSEITTLRLESLSSSGNNGPVIDDVRVSPYSPECDADINDDDTVNGADISVLLGYWGQSGKNVVGDITGDGIVNGADLALLLGNWGPCQ